MIFYDQEKEAPNEDLIEIKDKKIVSEVRKNLNLTFKDTDDIAPLWSEPLSYTMASKRSSKWWGQTYFHY